MNEVNVKFFIIALDYAILWVDTNILDETTRKKILNDIINLQKELKDQYL